MAFNLRNNQSILRSMIAQLVLLNPSITDYNEGAVARSIEQSVANEMERLDVDLYNGLNEAIITGTYKNFGFSRLPANFASGLVRLSGTVAGPVSIPIGTLFGVPGTGLVYASNIAETLNVSPGFVDVPVICQTLGSDGNTPSNTITSLLSTIPGITSPSCVNLSPFLNGFDQETDGQRFQRFQNSIAGLSRGTAYALRAAAEAQYLTDVNGNITERCIFAYIYEPWKFNGIIGNVFVYVDNGGATASPTLLAQIQNVEAGSPSVPGVIAAGVRVFTRAVVAYPVNVTATVYVALDYDETLVLASVSTAISNYFQSLQAGDQLILNEITRAALDVDGTTDFRMSDPVPPNNPSQPNLVPPIGNRITLGTLTLTAGTLPVLIDP